MADEDPLLDPDYRYSINRFTGDGAQTIWNLNFAGGFINREHIKAYLENADGTYTTLGFDWISDGSVDVTPAVADAQPFVFYRDTPKAAPLVDFNGGSAFTERNLDMLSRQAVFIGAETIDRFADVGNQSEAATITSIAALAKATEADAKADVAITDALNATATANDAQATADATAAGFEALTDTIDDLLGADLTGLARLDTAQNFTEAQQFRAGFSVRSSDGLEGITLLPGGGYQLISGGVPGSERAFGDWDTLVNKPASFPPSSHTQDWATITGKPTSFVPATHTHAYADITGKPLTFAPAAHGHAWGDIAVPSTIRNQIVSTSAPTGGNDGDVWLRYAP